MMDSLIETGKLREKRKSGDFGDSSDEETLQEKQKRIRISYSAAQKELKAKFFNQKAQDTVTDLDENTSELKGTQGGSSEITEDDSEKVKDSDTQEGIEMNKENERTPLHKKTRSDSETPFRLQKRPHSEIPSSSLKPSKTLRHLKKTTWVRNLEHDLSSDDEEDVNLSKEELLTKCQMQAYEKGQLKKELKQVKLENEHLRAALGLAKELPELLQKIRRLKSSTPNPSPTPIAVKRSPLTSQ
uniref:Uncharacterized protein LOC111116397 n=1 Tax=Crassostrea virginica TaxID=6565 RepID=A0A8B8C662_CRAVI|nr:uncharacterized protein LOC111116397 [Crassostrea virginica]